MKRERFDSGVRSCALTGIVLVVMACRQTLVSVDASALQITAAITPSEVSATRPPAGGVELVISVTNQRAHPVAVQLGGPPYKTGVIPAAETQGAGFGMRVLGADSATRRGPTEWTWGQPVINLGPRETLRHTFFLAVASTDTSVNRLKPGTYRIVPSFGRQEAAPLMLRVVP